MDEIIEFQGELNNYAASNNLIKKDFSTLPQHTPCNRLENNKNPLNSEPFSILKRSLQRLHCTLLCLILIN